MPTLRNISEEAFQSGFYEAQDVLAEADGVDLIDVKPARGFRQRDRWHRRLLYRGRGLAASLASANPGLRKVRLAREYELFVAVCQNFWDLLYLNAIEDWKSHGKLSVCWLGEFWSKDIETCPALLRGLKRFDAVFVNSWCAVEPLSKFLGRQCHFLPMAVDALRFCPAPGRSSRPIDVYSVGRRCEGVHGELLRAASERRMFYIYDSLRSMARVDVIDHRQHRELLANIAKRSKFFLVSPAKMNRPEETQGQLEIGARYFEGAAAGAVMLGQQPRGEAFQAMFPWPDAVFEILPDGSDVLKVMADLTSDPIRLAALRSRNTAESLLRHDWIHRWMTIYQSVGVAPSEGMTARVDQLRTLADEVLKEGSAAEPQSVGNLRVHIGRDAPLLLQQDAPHAPHLQQVSGATQ